ncbi:hypothetical protein GCK32_010261 [Trichostrongylus colubriformis]|uniref:Uncharacterized protein n=1 Tax=Trichostrongylus colubriformis TaxID=6319 RepID=A0AAN8FBC6_TRICO
MVDLDQDQMVMVCGGSVKDEREHSFLSGLATAYKKLKIVNTTQLDLTKDPRFYSVAHDLIRFSDRAFRVSDHQRRGVHQKWKPPYHANFFVIACKKSGKAIAFSQTSKNNENRWGAFYGNEQRYRPVIILDNTRTLVWAGPGSDLSRSMDHPRKAHALLAYLCSNTSIATAVTTPLLFSYYGLLYYTRGLVLRALSSAMRLAALTDAEVALLKQGLGRLTDAGAVIDIRDRLYPIFFDHNGPQLMPNGV